MSETSTTELIAEARSRVSANRLGMSWGRETDKDLLVINRLISALESLTATLTETEADLQASRGREKALRAQITAALVFADEAGEIDHEESSFAAGANAVAMLLEGYPSLTLEAVKADTTTEEIREYVEVGGQSRPWEGPTLNQDAARAAAFDRWLAAHDREVAEKCAQIAAASTIPLPGRGSLEHGSRSQWYANRVNDSAARIRAAFAPSTGNQTESETER
jgi:hypothetical protein